MELETAVRRHLVKDQTVNGYVQGKVFKHTLELNLEGTGGYAIVVRRAPGWALPDPIKSSEFPRLVVECWADPDRDEQGMKASENGATKALSLYRAVDRLLHAKRDVWWGAGGGERGLRIITSARDLDPAALGGPSASVDNRPALFGDLSMVPATYQIQTVH